MDHRYEDMILNTTDENKDELLQWISNPKSEIDQDYLINQLYSLMLSGPLRSFKLRIGYKLLEEINTDTAKFLYLIISLLDGDDINIELYKHLVNNKNLLSFINNEYCKLETRKLFYRSINLMKQGCFCNDHTKEITLMTQFTFSKVRDELDDLKEQNEELKRKLDEVYDMIDCHPDGPSGRAAIERLNEQKKRKREKTIEDYFQKKRKN